MKSDVKAIRKTSTGSVFGGRTRLRGIILASTGSAGSVTLQDGNSVTQFQVDVPAGDVFSYNLACSAVQCTHCVEIRVDNEGCYLGVT